MPRTRNTTDLLAGIGVAVLLLIGAVAYFWMTRVYAPPPRFESPMTNERVERSMNIGGDLVVALNAYRAKHGSFPETLDALVPEFVSMILPPSAGSREWGYKRHADGLDFTLRFGHGDGDSLFGPPLSEYWVGRTGEWASRL